jgi:glutaminyl-peptide cyclotransferase
VSGRFDPRACVGLALALGACATAGAAPIDAARPTPTCTYQVVHAYPHDRTAFTEGLLYRDGVFYESTGMNGASSIRKVDIETGRVLKQRNLPDAVFGEGIVDWHDELIGVTWRSQEGYVFDLASFDFKKKFAYPGEGWGMTRNDKQLLLSDGSARIRLLDPTTLAQTGAITVTDRGQPVTDLNELEWVKGTIYANVWRTSRIARIDPKSGRVTSWIDLSGLLSHSERNTEGADVLNGIAYDPKHDRLFVTGKYWPDVFEIKIVDKPAQN